MAEWSNEMCLSLIDNYEQYPVLWDPKNSFHYSKNKKADAWEAIAQNLAIDVNTVRQKMGSLLGSFRAQKSKGKKSVGTGKGRKDIYVSKWFAFERMQFLLDKDEPRNTIDTQPGDLDFIGSEDVSPDNNLNETLDDSSNLLSLPDETDLAAENNRNFNALQDAVPTAKPPEPKKRARKKKTSDEDPRIAEAFTMLQDTHAQYTASNRPQVNLPPDRFATYGQHVGNKIRTYSSRTQALVEHAINNILFEADMGNYEGTHSYTLVPNPPSNYSSTPVPSPDLSNCSSHPVPSTSSEFTPSSFINLN